MPVIYEKRTYSIRVGQMPELVRIYTSEAWPDMEAGGFGKKLIGYFISDTGDLHQLIHLWRFDSDDDRRAHWARLYQNSDFMAAVKQIRALVESQNMQLMLAAPWGPHL